MPGIIIMKIMEQSHRKGYTRGGDSTLKSPEIIEDEKNDGSLPEIMAIDDEDDVHQEPVRREISTIADEIVPPK